MKCRGVSPARVSARSPQLRSTTARMPVTKDPATIVRVVSQVCHCGKSVREVVCTEESVRGPRSTPATTSARNRGTATNTGATPLPHRSVRPLPSLTPTRVTTCPCGQTSLEKLYERDGWSRGPAAWTRAPDLRDDLQRQAGLVVHPLLVHTCSAVCHAGPCPTCPRRPWCGAGCGHMDKEIACCQHTTGRPDARCEKRCQKKRSCEGGTSAIRHCCRHRDRARLHAHL